MARRADRPAAIAPGADKANDAEGFVNALRSMDVTPHVAQNTSGRSTAMDRRTIRHGDHAASPRIRNADRAGIQWDQTSRAEKRSPASVTAITSRGPSGHRPRFGAAVQADRKNCSMATAFGVAKDFVGLAHCRDGGHGDLLDLVEGASDFAWHVRWRSHFCGSYLSGSYLWGSHRSSGHALQIGCAAFSFCREPVQRNASQRDRRGRCRFVEPVGRGVVRNSSRGRPAPWCLLPGVYSEPLRSVSDAPARCRAADPIRK